MKYAIKIMLFFIIIFVFMVITADNCSAQFSGSIELGTGEVRLHGERTQITETEIKLGYKFSSFNVYSTITTMNFPLNIYQHQPFRDDYSIGVSKSVNNFIVSFEHHCAHPVYSNYGVFWKDNCWIGETTMLKVKFNFGTK